MSYSLLSNVHHVKSVGLIKVLSPCAPIPMSRYGLLMWAENGSGHHPGPVGGGALFGEVLLS